MSDPNRSRMHRLVVGLGGIVRIVVLVVGVIVVALLALGSRTADPSVSASPSLLAGVGASGAPTAEPSFATPTPAPASTVAPPDVVTAPTLTPWPTTVPTSKPTAKPTPKPKHDPAPEGTPRITTRSGSFGQTLTVQGISARVAKTAPQAGAQSCVTDDPERQGWTELVSYELRMTWPASGDAEEPWVAVGSTPWNVLTFDGPSPFKSGADYIVSTCHRPSDSDKVMVEISPPGSPLIYYRWFFD